MADNQEQIDAAELKKRRSFKKFSYRGVDLKDLLEISPEDFAQLAHARVRRRIRHGFKIKPTRLVKKLRAAKLAAGPNEKPAVVKTHLRNMVILPEMIGSVVGVYNGKVFNQVEVKPEMVGHYLGEFSITYRPVAHKRAGNAGNDRFLPLR